jgi:tRNA-intron endonuclease
MDEYIYKDGVFVGKKPLSLYEGLFLLEKGEIIVKDPSGRTLTLKDILTPEMEIRYKVYKYFKEKGLKFGAGMKFGGTFRVYEDYEDEHSRWICFPVKEDDYFTAYDFIAKNRVAHSTRKSLLIAIVGKDDISFLESRWVRL